MRAVFLFKPPGVRGALPRTADLPLVGQPIALFVLLHPPAVDRRSPDDLVPIVVGHDQVVTPVRLPVFSKFAGDISCFGFGGLRRGAISPVWSSNARASPLT